MAAKGMVVCGACNSPKRASEMVTKKMCKSCLNKGIRAPKGKKGKK